MKLDTASYVSQLSGLQKKLPATPSSLSTATSLLGKLGAKNVLSGDIASLTKGLPSTTSLFDNALSKVSSGLSSISDGLKLVQAQADKEFANLSTSLNGGGNSAIAQETSFITGSAMSNIRAMDQATAAEIPADTSNFSSTQLAKLSEMSGMDITSNEALTTAQATVADNLKIAQCTSLGRADALMSDLTSTTGSSQLLPWQATGSLPTSFPEIETLVPTDVTTRAAQLTEKLPNEKLTDLWGSTDSVTAYTKQITNATTGTSTLNLNSLSSSGSPLEKMFSDRTDMLAAFPTGTFDDPTGDLFGLMAMGDQYNSYPEMADSAGLEIPGLSNGTTSHRQTNSLYDAAQSLCGNVTKGFSRYGSNKDLFDLLMNQALKNGMADLINQLLNCTKYVDSRTNAILGSSLPSLAKGGDIASYSKVVDHLGVGAIAEPKKSLRIMGANMDPTETNLTNYDQLRQHTGIPSQQLYTRDDDPEIYSGEDVAFMSTKSTKLINQHLGEDDPLLIAETYLAFA